MKKNLTLALVFLTVFSLAGAKVHAGIEKWLGVPQQGGLPSQAGNNGKVLGTDGTTASWVAAAGGGTMKVIKENNVQVGDQDILTLDFLGADFDLAESPDTEIQVVVAAAITRDTEWDTFAEINAASTDTDAVLDTDIGVTVLAPNGDGSGLTSVTAADLSINIVDWTDVFYTNTLAGNIGAQTDECWFVSTASGGGFLCEGSTVNDNEQLYLFPDLDGADTTEYISILSALPGSDNNFCQANGTAGKTDCTIGSSGTGNVALVDSPIFTTGVNIDNVDTTITRSGAGEIAVEGVEQYDTDDTVTNSVVWNAAGISSDGTQCADAAQVTINSGPKEYTIICTDNDASTMYGSTIMPDGWNAGTVTFELEYVQTAADTNVLNADVTAMCRGAGSTINSTWGTEVAIDDAALAGSNAVEQTTSGAVTPNGTCAAGDALFWRIQLDATGTTTAVATLHFLGVKMEYTSTISD